MNYYLIDYENVRIADINVLSGLDDGDKVIIFYSDVCKNGNLDFIANINLKNAEFRCQKVNIGTKNALDFQLSSQFGYWVGVASKDTNFYIISNDKGYDCLIAYWKAKNVNVSRIAISNPHNKESSSKGAVEVSYPTKKASMVPATDRTSLTDINKYLSNIFSKKI